MSSLKNLSKRDQMIIIALVGVILVALYYFFMLSPMIKQLGDTGIRIEEEKQKLAENQLSIQRLKEIQKEAFITEAQLMKLRKLLPPDVELPSLIVQMNSNVGQASLSWPEVRPGEPVQMPDYSIYPVQFTFKGGYLDFLDFLYRLYRFPRLMTINSVEIQQQKELVNGVTKMNLEINVNSNIYLARTTTQAASPVAPAATTGAPVTGGGG